MLAKGKPIVFITYIKGRVVGSKLNFKYVWGRWLNVVVDLLVLKFSMF